MTRRREFSQTAPGVVKIRLSGDPAAADALARMLREHPGAEILTGPDTYPGDRLYLLARIQPKATRDVLEAADIAYDRTHPDPYRSWSNGEPPAGGAQ